MIIINIYCFKDCPYCEIRPTHACYKYVKTFRDSQVKKVKLYIKCWSIFLFNLKEKFKEGCFIKGRNEPWNIK